MRLWIRADASPAIGIGHVMRTLACAEIAAARGISVEYVMASDIHTNEIPLLLGYQGRILDHPSDQSWIEDISPGDAVLFDGYHFGPEDFAAANNSGATVGAVDDFGVGEFLVDVLVNQNLGKPNTYRTRSDTRVLLGPRYAMVREEFRRRRRLRGCQVNTLVISFGGSDTAGLSVSALELALESSFQHIFLLVGPAAEVDVKSISAPTSSKQVHVVREPPSVAEVFDRADAAVAAAGSTTWELLCMGVPAVLVEVTDNQAGIGQGVSSAGAGIFAGGPEALAWALPAAWDKLGFCEDAVRMSKRCLELVDGLGASRVVASLIGGEPLREKRSEGI